MKTHLFLEVIITWSKEVFKDFESNMAVSSRELGNLTGNTAKSNVTVLKLACSIRLTVLPQARKSDL
jgi:hypothetical protein